MGYDQDRIIQHYYKQFNEARLLLTALIETATDEDVKRNIYVTFEKHIDLKEACQDWNRSTLTTWAEMKTHVSTKIQMNKTNLAIMQQKEQVNAVLDQTKEHEETQQQALEVAVLQSQKLQALRAKIEQQIANIATSSGSSIPRRILATIDTNSSGGGSTKALLQRKK